MFLICIDVLLYSAEAPNRADIRGCDGGHGAQSFARVGWQAFNGEHGMYVCMYVCMYIVLIVCIYACMYVCNITTVRAGVILCVSASVCIYEHPLYEGVDECLCMSKYDVSAATTVLGPC